jgi:hypothetical protein
MQDVAIELEDRPGALAEMGEALGRAGVSIEGGGAWVVNGVSAPGEAVDPLLALKCQAVAHFLFENGAAARNALEAAGIKVLAVRDVVVQRLNQDEPGQLGKITRRMAEAGVNIEVLYSDHANQLILVVDDIVKARQVVEVWTRETIKRRLAALHVEP